MQYMGDSCKAAYDSWEAYENCEAYENKVTPRVVEEEKPPVVVDEEHHKPFYPLRRAESHRSLILLGTYTHLWVEHTSCFSFKNVGCRVLNFGPIPIPNA